MSDSKRPRGQQPSRLLHPWDFPGKSTGVGQDLLKQSKMRPAVSSVTAYAKHLEINLQYHYLKGICRSLTFLLCFRPSKGAPYVEGLCLWERKKAKLPSCVRLCDPMDCSPPGSSVHGSLQARILEWVTIPFSRGSSQPRDRTQVSCIAGRFFTI